MCVMTAGLTYCGHCCFGVQGPGSTIWSAPYFTENPHTDLAPEDITELDYILASHAHGDHLENATPIAQRTGALVISNHDIPVYCQERGAHAHGMHIGGGHPFPFGGVKMTMAHDGSSFADGS